MIDIRSLTFTYPGQATPVFQTLDWRVGRGQYACILSLVTTSDASPAYFKEQLRVHEKLAHVTVEVNNTHAPNLFEADHVSD